MTTAEGRRERRRRETRERLLKAALDLFATQGYTATTFDHIAARADVGRQTAFNHFRRKEDFVTAWVELRHRHLAELTAAASDDTPPFELLAGLLRALSSLNENDGDYALAKDLYDNGVVQAAFTDGADVPEAFRTAFERARDLGELRPGVTPEIAAELLFDSYIGTLARWLASGGAFPLGETLETRLAVLRTGLSPSTDRATPV